MLFWLITGFLFFYMDALWALALSFILVTFFPRIAWAAFAFVAFPVWTLWFSTWAFLLGWLFNFCPFTLEAWKTCFWVTAVPVGLFCYVTGKAATEQS